MVARDVQFPPRGLFLNNKFTDTVDSSSERIKLFNPTDDSLLLDDVPVANKDDIDRAVENSEHACRHGPWAEFTHAQRAACLNRFADLIEANKERLAVLESLPTGRPINGILNFDLPHMVDVFRYYAGWVDKIGGQTYESDDGVVQLVKYYPLGVCAAIASWNATFMYVAWKLAPALAAGNTVIFKPSEKSPLGCLALGPLFAEAGFPEGVVQLVPGASETGALLASHMRIAKISFTGSIAGGRAVQEAATKSNLKKVTLELGGKSAAIVFEDAKFDSAVREVGAGFLANSGQICVAASRVLVQESIATQFIEGIRREFETAEKGLGDDPLELGTSLGPVVDKLQFDRIMRYIEMGKSTAKLIFGGTRKSSSGCYIKPTLFLNPTDDSPIWTEEIFGPVLAVRTFKDVDEAIKLANDTSYGLASCIYTSDIAKALQVSSAMESGVVTVNSPHIPQLNTPFGGIKQSGIGRELGTHGMYSYLEPKTIHIHFPK